MLNKWTRSLYKWSRPAASIRNTIRFIFEVLTWALWEALTSSASKIKRFKFEAFPYYVPHWNPTGVVKTMIGGHWARASSTLRATSRHWCIGCPRIIRTYDFTRMSSLWCNRRSSSFQTFLKYTSKVIDECCIVPRSGRGLVPSPVRLALG